MSEHTAWGIWAIVTGVVGVLLSLGTLLWKIDGDGSVDVPWLKYVWIAYGLWIAPPLLRAYLIVLAS